MFRDVEKSKSEWNLSSKMCTRPGMWWHHAVWQRPGKAGVGRVWRSLGPVGFPRWCRWPGHEVSNPAVSIWNLKGHFSVWYFTPQTFCPPWAFEKPEWALFKQKSPGPQEKCRSPLTGTETFLWGPRSCIGSMLSI